MDQFCVIRVPVCELLDWMSGPGVWGGDLRVQLQTYGWEHSKKTQAGVAWRQRSGPLICVVPVPVLPHVGHSVVLSLTSR